MFSFTPRPLYLQAKGAVPIEDSGWAPESVWTFWRKEKYLAPAGIFFCNSRSIFPTIHTLLIQNNNRQSFRRQDPAVNTNPTFIQFGIAHDSITLNIFSLNKVYNYLFRFPDLRGTNVIKLGHTKTSPFSQS